MKSDVWAITPATDDDRYRLSAAIGGAGALTLLTNVAGVHGVGYKIVITSTGNETTKNFTIIGYTPGGEYVTETFTGPNATTKNSTYFYSTITSISINAASVGSVKIGTVGDMGFPHTRIKAIQYAASASAGTAVFNLSGGTHIFTINTPASAAATDTVNIPDNGILTGRSSAYDFATVTLTNVTAITIFCG